MFKKKTDIIMLDQLEMTIDSVYSDMKGFTSDTEEYSSMADQLIKLLKLRDELSSKSKVSAETLATIGGNLIGILMILNYERANVIASKALSFVMKLR